MKSANLNVIIRVIDKISGRLARDFGEIENLQNNQFSVTKFANACYVRIADSLASELSKVHPDYNIEFSDGRKIINNQDADYTYLICPIDGLLNLSRAIPYFSVVIALEHKMANGKKELIISTIVNIADNELYFCEKGQGAFLNNRRIRVSSRQNGDEMVFCLADIELVKKLKINKKNHLRISNCSSLDIAYLASGRVDLLVIDESNLPILNLVSLFVKEAGGGLMQKNDLYFSSNNKIDNLLNQII